MIRALAIATASCAVAVHAAVDWGGGAAVFYGGDGQPLAANGLAVLLSVHAGRLVDVRCADLGPTDLRTPGSVVADGAGNENIVLGAFSPFTSGYLLNSIVPNVTKATQQGLGAAPGEDLYLLVLDTTTLADGAPVATSAVAVLTLFVDGDTAASARTYGNVPPALPVRAEPDEEIGEVRHVRLYAGWNLRSVPTKPLHPTPMGVFGSPIQGPVWEWTPDARGDFQQTTVVVTKRGYWVRTLEERSVAVEGQPETDSEVQLAAGWNLVGTVLACDRPDTDEVIGPLWWWDGVLQGFRRLRQGEQMLPWRAYWIYSRAAVTVALE